MSWASASLRNSARWLIATVFLTGCGESWGTVQGTATLDDRPVLNFLLTPNAKKAKEAARAVARIQLWVDPATGIPARQLVVHSSGLVELDARIHNAKRDDALSGALFQPRWPEGTKVVRK